MAFRKQPAPSPATPLPKNRAWSWTLAVGSVACLVYLNALDGQFVWDDVLIIVRNPKVVGEATVRELLVTDLWASVSSTSSFYRPLPLLLFRGLHVAWGLDPLPFHVVNVALHAATSMLVVWIAQILLAARGPQALAPSAAAGLLFAVHPVHTQAVAWSSGVMDVGATCFSLLAIALAIRRTGHPRLQTMGASVSLLVAFLFKEVALVSVAVIGAHDLLRRERGHPTAFAVERWAGLLIAVGLYFSLRAIALGGAVTAAGTSLANPGALVTEAPRLLLRYLGALVFPHPLAALHDLRAVRGTALTVAAAFGVTLLVSAFVFLARRSRGIVVPGLLLLLPLAPPLVVAAMLAPDELHNAYAERYLYFPSVGLVLCLALGLDRIPRRWWYRATPAVALLLAGLTIRQNTAWTTDLTLWGDNVRRYPDLAIAKLNLAAAQQDAGDLTGSLSTLSTIRAPARSDIVPYLVLLGTNAGRLGDSGRAVALLSEAAALSPDSAEVQFNLGVALDAVGRQGDAIAAYQRCLELRASHPDAHNNLGVLLARRGDLTSARTHFAAAAQARRHDEAARRNLAEAERQLAQRAAR